MARTPRPYAASYSFGPGPISPAVKWLLIANIGVFIVEFFAPKLITLFGLSPESVLHGWIWQPATYMFLHHPGAFGHILFNMLGLWMFGVELERLWGTLFFLRFYFVTGIGAAVTTLVIALLPFAFAEQVFYSTTIGASGAIYGLLFAYAYYYPDRPILLVIFPVPAKYAVMVLGGFAFFASISGGGGVAHATHLGGLLAAYIYLKSGRGGIMAEVKYRWVKWKMNRLRRKFDVHQGGRNRWDKTVH